MFSKYKLKLVKTGCTKSSVKVVTCIAICGNIGVSRFPAMSSTEPFSTEIYVVRLSTASVKSLLIKLRSSS